MNTTISRFNINSQQLCSKKGETTLFLTDITKSNIVVPKTILWSQISLPETWKLENVSPPTKQENRKLERIIQYVDGDAEIKFASQRRFRIKMDEEARSSTSSVPYTDHEKMTVSGINITPEQVSQPEYKVEMPKSQSSRNLDHQLFQILDTMYS